MYYYSCNNCGLPEKNPNHTFSKNEYYEYDYSKYPHSYTRSYTVKGESHNT